MSPQPWKRWKHPIKDEELWLEFHRLRAENLRLKRRIRELEAARDRWRNEAHNWKWGALRWGKNTYV